MIIIYDKANTLTLPYSDEKGAVAYVTFVPGTNDVDSKTWEAIREYNEARFEYYDRFLHALNEEAAGDDGIDYSALNVKDLSKLIGNTMDIDKLGEIESAENLREKPRKSVLQEIEKQIEAISTFVEKVEKEKE